MARKATTKGKEDKGARRPGRGQAPGGPPPPAIPPAPAPAGPPPPFEDPTPSRAWLSRMPEWAGPFLEALPVLYGNVRGACMAARISHVSVYAWKKRVPEFSAAWDHAVEEGLDSAELQLLAAPRDLRARDLHENFKWLLEKKRYNVGHRERILAKARRDMVEEEAEKAQAARDRGEDPKAIPRATVPTQQAAAALMILQGIVAAQQTMEGSMPSPSSDIAESLAALIGTEDPE